MTIVPSRDAFISHLSNTLQEHDWCKLFSTFVIIERGRDEFITHFSAALEELDWSA